MTINKMTAGIYTLGCKVNQYESQAIGEELQRRGFELLSPSSVCDVYVINTCTVTAESDRKARQFIRRVIAKNPNARVIVTGCLAQTSPNEVAKIEGVDAVVGNSDKLLCAAIASELVSDTKPSSVRISAPPIDNAPFEKMSITSFDRTRAYVKIEDGCESNCAYCIIPYARGRIRSKPVEDIIDEIRALNANGCPEIVLTGIETASYGKDLKDTDLSDLLCLVDKLEGIGRVRLGSLDPSLITPKFVSKIADLSSLAPHFHLSLQSGSSTVLAAMKRKYNADMAMRSIELLKKSIPNVKLTTDIIVGFPRETEENFLETVDFVKEAGFLSAHIFPYSKREGTPAAAMSGQISKEEKSRRLHLLSEVEASIRMGILKNEISARPERTVLFETFRCGIATGHTDDFLEVCVSSPIPLHAQFKKVRLIKTDGSLCFGKLID